ncbi:MAG: sigma-70 family RNA polymerase sigma factor [Fuerstiella sp.]
MPAQPTEPIKTRRFHELLQKVASGDQAASESLISEYGTHILRAVRRRMNRGMRDRFDSEDFAQAVWASFFGHLSVVQRIENEGDLAGFLGRMAANKVIDAGRRRQSRPETKAANEILPQVVMDNRRRVSQPTPSQFAVANEQWDQLTENENATHTRLLRLLRAGATQVEIAKVMGVSERHVRRIISRISGKRLNDPAAE